MEWINSPLGAKSNCLAIGFKKPSPAVVASICDRCLRRSDTATPARWCQSPIAAQRDCAQHCVVFFTRCNGKTVAQLRNCLNIESTRLQGGHFGCSADGPFLPAHLSNRPLIWPMACRTFPPVNVDS